MELSLHRCASSQASLCQKGSEPRLRRDFFFSVGVAGPALPSCAGPPLLAQSSPWGLYESETERVSKRDSSEVLAGGLDAMPHTACLRQATLGPAR